MVKKSKKAKPSKKSFKKPSKTPKRALKLARSSPAIKAKTKPLHKNKGPKFKVKKLPILNTGKVIPVKPPKEAPKIEKPVLDPKDIEKVATILADSEVRQLLIELAGENALAIVRSFYGNHSDDDLAKQLKLKISDVRATLNKLHNEGLVNYLREKDSETGWYSYSWSLNLPRIEKWVDLQSNRFNLSGETTDYYFCNSCGASSITNFESASKLEFRCDRCNKLLDFMDDKKMNELRFDRKK